MANLSAGRYSGSLNMYIRKSFFVKINYSTSAASQVNDLSVQPYPDYGDYCRKKCFKM